MSEIPSTPRPSAKLPWYDGDAELAESYRGGSRKAAISANLNSLADDFGMLIGLAPTERYLDRPSYKYEFTIAQSARAGYHYSGPVGAVGRSIVEGLPLTIVGVVVAPFAIAKDVVDLAGHLGAAMLGK